jgi:predicted dehydrogenase
MPTLKYCVVGAGHWSTTMHLPALKKLSRENDVGVAGVCDLDEEKARAYAAELGSAGAYSDLEKMISEADPDAVAILVPTGVSAEVIRRVAKLGKPFLAEKPPAPTSDEHRRLIDEVGGLVHVVAYNRRHSPYVARARELLAGKKLQVVAGHFSRSRRRREDFSTTAVHAIDTLRCLGGDWATMRLETVHTGEVLNFFADGWTRAGARLDLHVTPDTGSGEEHYFLRSEELNVFVVFPHWSLADYPGYVEARRGKIERERFGAEELGLDPEDRPTMAGIHAEHLALVEALRSGRPAESTLAATLQTQLIREEFKKMVEGGQARAVAEVSF